MRNLDADNVSQAVLETGSYPVDLIEIALDPDNADRILRVSTHFKSATIGDKTFEPMGALLGMSEITETRDAKTNPLNIQLSGIDDVIISILDSEPVFGSSVTVWRGFYDTATGDFAATPYIRWNGIVISTSTTIDNSREGAVNISVQCKSKLASLLNAKGGRFTSPDSFKRFDSSDNSMEFVASLRTFTPTFGGA